MITQAEDYRQEAKALYDGVGALKDNDFFTVTQFKNWTIDDVFGHLHMFDVAALDALTARDKFAEFCKGVMAQMKSGKSLVEIQRPWLQELGGDNPSGRGLAGTRLFEAWYETSIQLADAYGEADPKQRVDWLGPQMSAVSSITARQMETWAHGQEVLDILGLDRENTDRIKNICHMGVITHDWTYKNSGETPPSTAPFLQLSAPSGTVWEWNAECDQNFVKGAAVEFAQVVTQTRNVADTSLEIEGEDARWWMEHAQCFAGPPNPPPKPGSRFKV